jgi:hypothetical protein
MCMTRTRETKRPSGFGAAGKRRGAQAGAGAGLMHQKDHHAAGLSLRSMAGRLAAPSNGLPAPCA